MTRTQSELALATVQDRTLALTHTLSVATNLCKRVLALMASDMQNTNDTHDTHNTRQGERTQGHRAQLSPSASECVRACVY